jgi:hypothetical protein
MSTLITNNLKLFSSDNFVESFTEPGFNIYYMFVGNPLPFTNDNSPPQLYDNIDTTNVKVFENMIYGKRITSNDIVKLIRRTDWTSGEVYQKYTHDNTNLFNEDFFVMVDETTSYSVFKCLDNNGGANSTDAPLLTETSADDDFYFTSDGYQWKYMYSITPSQLSKFGTTDYIPVFVNQNVVSNAVGGSIDNIQVTFGGIGYASYASGTFQEVQVGGSETTFKIDPSSSSSNANFYTGCAIKITSGVGSGQLRKITSYTVVGATRTITTDLEFDPPPTTSSGYEITPFVTISGDGSNASARAIVNATSNTIYRIEVVDRGINYSYADVVVTGNTGTASPTPENTATAKVIISPKGGHGSNAAAELGCHNVGISVEFDSAVSGNKIVDENDFRSIGIIKDPLFSNVQIGSSIGDRSGTFVDGEVITQTSGFEVAGIVITSPGSGYTANATVTITGTNITPVSANASSNSSGKISAINIANNGSGYESVPSVSISAPLALSFNAQSAVDGSSDFITISGHKFQDNDYVKYLVASGNTSLTNLANNTSYWVVSSNSSGVKLATTREGSPINLSPGAVSETGHTLTGQTATATAVLDLDSIVTACGVITVVDTNYIRVTNAYGFFTTGSLIIGETSGASSPVSNVTQPSSYFDQTFKIVATQPSPPFQEDELVVQSTNANGYVYSANSSTMRIVNKKGVFNKSEVGGTTYYVDGITSGVQAEITGTIEGDLVRGTGDVIYMENFTPITKTGGQKETFKLILDF